MVLQYDSSIDVKTVLTEIIPSVQWCSTLFKGVGDVS